MKIKTDSKKTIKSYKHPNESEKYYNKLLTLGAQELDKKAGVYGICINGVTIYVGQSLNLLRRLADHLYWMCKWNDENNPNTQLYLLLRQALQNDCLITFVVFVHISDDFSFKMKQEKLNIYESEIIKGKLPIANKKIPDVFDKNENMQILHVDEDNVNKFFSNGFCECRQFLDKDLRKEYFYIYNEHFDEKLKTIKSSINITTELVYLEENVECPYIEPIKDVVKDSNYAFYCDFSWMFFKYGEKLLPNIKKSHLVRLIYLATLVDYNGRLPPTNIIKSKLKLSSKYWSEFLRSMMDNDVVFEDKLEKCLCLNKDYFAKGSLQETNNNFDCTRLYCSFIKKIYESYHDEKAFVQISYLYRLIPFINRKTNIVCKNPEEQNPDKIQLITLTEFCDIIGYNKSNAKRLVKDLSALEYDGQSLIRFIKSSLSKSTWKIIVNPRMYYGGQNDKIYKEQVALLTDYNPQEAFDVNNTKL